MVTVKITARARAILKTLAAYYQMPMHEVAENVFFVKAAQLQLKWDEKPKRRASKQKGDK